MLIKYRINKNIALKVIWKRKVKNQTHLNTHTHIDIIYYVTEYKTNGIVASLSKDKLYNRLESHG